MSCQQVPRLPEDPYTFTEPPVTAKYFSSQSHKVHSKKSLASPQSPAISPKSNPKPTAQRVTGQSPLGGLLPKRNGPIYGKTPNRQQQQQHHHHHLPSPLPGSANAASTASVSPPPHTNNNIQSNSQPAQQFHPPTAVTPSPLLPNSSASTESSANHQSSNYPPTCITTTAPSSTTNVHTSLGQAVSGPPAIQSPQQVRTAKSTSGNTGMPALNLHSTSSSSSPMLRDTKTYQPEKSASKVSAHTAAKTNSSVRYTLSKKSQFRGDIEFAAFANRNKHNKSKICAGRAGKSAPPTPLYRKSSISSTCSSSASSSPPSFPSDSGSVQPMSNNEDSFFVRPVKIEPKVTPSISANISNHPSDAEARGRGGMTTVRSKRSYSQSSHHEALQRIPVKEIKLEVKEEVHDTDTKHGIVKFENQHPTVIVAQIRNRRNQEWAAPGVHFGIAPVPSAPGSISCTLPLLDTQQCWFTNEARFTTRDQRLEHKLTLLRRQARQLSAAQRFRSTAMPRRRLQLISKSLAMNTQKPQRLCEVTTCNAIALVEATFCLAHIARNQHQLLFQACTAKFSDNSQCRLAVFDVSHDLPLCREHAWKVDNYSRKTHEQKQPKKVAATPPASRKKSKNCALPRPPKRNRKKKVNPKAPSVAHPQPHMSPATRLYQAPERSPISIQHFALSSNDSFISSDVSQMFPPSPQHQTPAIMPQHPVHQSLYPFQQTLNSHHHQHQQQLLQTTHPTSGQHHYFAPHNATVALDPNQFFGQMLVTSDGSTPTSQDFYTLCENSSAYESSEDTGIGGLSETEQQLMGVHDGDMLEDHDINTVLNQLPQNAFDELFTGHQTVYKPTAEEEEYLDRALEAVDEQVKTLQKMTGSDHFLDDFLDVDEQILEDVDMCGVDESIHSTVGLTNVSGSSAMSIGSIIDLRGLVHT